MTVIGLQETRLNIAWVTPVCLNHNIDIFGNSNEQKGENKNMKQSVSWKLSKIKVRKHYSDHNHFLKLFRSQNLAKWDSIEFKVKLTLSQNVA